MHKTRVRVNATFENNAVVGSWPSLAPPTLTPPCVSPES
jgi:hypothetical protein